MESWLKETCHLTLSLSLHLVGRIVVKVIIANIAENLQFDILQDDYYKKSFSEKVMSIFLTSNSMFLVLYAIVFKYSVF